MIQGFSSLFLTLEAFKQDRIGFDLRVRNFDGHGQVGHQVSRFVGGCATVVGDQRLDAVVIQLITRLDGCDALIIQGLIVMFPASGMLSSCAL